MCSFGVTVDEDRSDETDETDEDIEDEDNAGGFDGEMGALDGAGDLAEEVEGNSRALRSMSSNVNLAFAIDVS